MKSRAINKMVVVATGLQQAPLSFLQAGHKTPIGCQTRRARQELEMILRFLLCFTEDVPSEKNPDLHSLTELSL